MKSRHHRRSSVCEREISNSVNRVRKKERKKERERGGEREREGEGERETSKPNCTAWEVVHASNPLPLFPFHSFFCLSCCFIFVSFILSFLFHFLINMIPSLFILDPISASVFFISFYKWYSLFSVSYHFLLIIMSFSLILCFFLCVFLSFRLSFSTWFTLFSFLFFETRVCAQTSSRTHELAKPLADVFRALLASTCYAREINRQNEAKHRWIVKQHL